MISGLVAGLERRNGWMLAEHAGKVSLGDMQWPLHSMGWGSTPLHWWLATGR
jgi:hypothetical protein